MLVLVPVLLLWERADGADRKRLEELVRNFNGGAMTGIIKLLAKYDALSASLDIMRQYLEKARRVLRALPHSNGQAGLHGLTEYLAGQTEALRVVPENSL